MVKHCLFVLAVVAGCSTKANPNACCVSADDCKQAGLSSAKSCGQGLTCIDNQCIQETCSTDGCTASMPYCNVVSNVCEGCTDSSQCASYAGTTVCDPTSGACVGCVSTTDCPASKPVCDMNACRACKADVDCVSGACADDGTCVSESAIVYLDPGGTDTGTCPSSAPCRSITYGVTETSDTRPHMVMHQGAYVENVNLRNYTPPTPLVFLHGGGSTLTNPTAVDAATFTGNGFSIRYLTVVNGGGTALTVSNGDLRHVHVRATGNGAQTGGTYSILDTVFEGQGAGAAVSAGAGTLTMDEVVIQGPWVNGVFANDFTAVINVTNSLIYRTTGLAMDLTTSNGGTIAFTTIADSGSDSGSGPRAVNCPANATFRSSIIWAPGTTTRVPLQGCNVVSSIAGPAAISGVSNADPMFMNSAQHDYHLGTGSPAVDFVQAGPDHDFEGDPRPKGAGYDIGADEAR